MNFQPADTTSLLLFCLFALLMLFFNFKIISQSSGWKVWSALFVALLGTFTLAALSGAVAQNFAPLGPILIALAIIFSLAFSFSQSGFEISQSLSFVSLVGFQGFRLFLELILHHWASIGTVPVTMTWSGQNWDVVAGIVSLFSIPFLKNNRKLVIAVNAIGFILLVNVLRVVVFSLPLPFSWELEKPLLLAAYFPYCLIVPLFVLPALTCHLLTFRKLWDTRKM